METSLIVVERFRICVERLLDSLTVSFQLHSGSVAAERPRQPWIEEEFSKLSSKYDTVSLLDARHRLPVPVVFVAPVRGRLVPSDATRDLAAVHIQLASVTTSQIRVDAITLTADALVVVVSAAAAAIFRRTSSVPQECYKEWALSNSNTLPILTLAVVHPKTVSTQEPFTKQSTRESSLFNPATTTEIHKSVLNTNAPKQYNVRWEGSGKLRLTTPRLPSEKTTERDHDPRK